MLSDFLKYISVENSESWRDISALIRDFFRKIADFFIRGRSQNEMPANEEDGLYFLKHNLSFDCAAI